MSKVEEAFSSVRLMTTIRTCGILWLIRKKPCHGYELIKQLQNLLPDGIMITESGMYPSVKRMEKDSLLKSKMDTTTSKERPRKVYRITPKGIDYLKDQVELLEKYKELMMKASEFLDIVIKDVDGWHKKRGAPDL